MINPYWAVLAHFLFTPAETEKLDHSHKLSACTLFCSVLFVLSFIPLKQGQVSCKSRVLLICVLRNAIFVSGCVEETWCKENRPTIYYGGERICHNISSHSTRMKRFMLCHLSPKSSSLFLNCLCCL